mmetsp:Transcript_2345/g.5535  ORF Transcript_2345/g.5535 Transcript_2345/m.5535 type:complete len:231 (+) Transcript_2345:2935-3627(+)
MESGRGRIDEVCTLTASLVQCPDTAISPSLISSNTLTSPSDVDLKDLISSTVMSLCSPAGVLPTIATVESMKSANGSGCSPARSSFTFGGPWTSIVKFFETKMSCCAVWRRPLMTSRCWPLSANTTEAFAPPTRPSSGDGLSCTFWMLPKLSASMSIPFRDREGSGPQNDSAEMRSSSSTGFPATTGPFGFVYSFRGSSWTSMTKRVKRTSLPLRAAETTAYFPGRVNRW